MNRLIIYLIRKRLKLKRNEKFRFKNQRDKKDYYFFGKTKLIKGEYICGRYMFKDSKCSLNHLLSEECEIERVEE